MTPTQGQFSALRIQVHPDLRAAIRQAPYTSMSTSFTIEDVLLASTSRSRGRSLL